MKDKFWGYYPYDDKTFENLWQSANFVVDANILLNLYRYSKDTQLKVIECLNEVSERLWIPYNSVDEYFRNRVNVILEQQKIHNSLRAEFKFDKLKNYIESLRHLTLDKVSLLSVVEEYEIKINEIIDEDARKSMNFLEKDTVLENILQLYDKKIGEKPTEQYLRNMEKIIDDRYEKGIPPGFEDAKKQKPGRKYGDCLNWFEIIEYSKKNKKDIIYITDDNKQDWLYECQGKKLGPRPELLNEFYRETQGNTIYIYRTETFLERFNKYVNPKTEISKGTIDEIKNVVAINYEKNDFDMLLRKGDIYIANLGMENESAIGRSPDLERMGMRPVVIISGRKYNSFVIVAPITSNANKISVGKHVMKLSEDYDFIKDSAILLDKLKYIGKEHLKEKIGHLTKEDIIRLNQVILKQENRKYDFLESVKEQFNK